MRTFSYVFASFLFGFCVCSYFLFGKRNDVKRDSESEHIVENISVDSYEILSEESMKGEVRLRGEAEGLSLSDLASLVEELYLAGDAGVCEVFRVWLERDLSGAKQWLLDKPFLIKETERRFSGGYYQNSEVTRPNMLVQAMGKDLFRIWMKRDRDGCFAFVNESSAMVNENYGWAILFWGSEASKHCPQIYAYWRDALESGKMPEAYSHSGFDFWGEWYQRDPQAALMAMNEITNVTVRNNVLGRIVEQLQINDPQEAIRLICENFEGINRQQSLMRAVQFFARNDPRGTLLFWSKTDLYGDDLAAIQRGVMSAIKVNDLIALFEDPSLGLDEMARAEIARDYFNTGYYRAPSGRRHYSGIGRNEDAEAKAELLQYMDDREREKLIKDIFEMGRDWNFAFSVYEQLSAQDREKISLAMAMFHARDTVFTAKLYAEKLYKETDDLGNSGFDFAVWYSIEKDRRPMEEWSKTLPEGRLKDVVQLLLDVDALNENYDEKFVLLNNFYDKSVARYPFIQEAKEASKNNFPAYIRALNNTPHADWAIDTIDNTFWTIFLADKDCLWNFVEGLKDAPQVLAFLKYKFADEMGGEENKAYFKTALEFALDLEPSPKTDDLVKRALERYKKSNPEEAKKWCEENGIPWE